MAKEAREVGLLYSNDKSPGIRRKLRGKSFAYSRESGASIRDQATLLRIKRLAIPPAWTEVWICPHEKGHIQATGRDARGRKQYRYHSHWRQQRDENKFGRMLAFARALPRIRRKVKHDLARTGMPREKVLATVVRLLEATLIRIGNDEYARQNDSYGLTTLRNRHARVNGSLIRFTFRGKSARKHEISVRDPQLARIVRRCQEMPGQELFSYEETDGKARDVRSEDVNEYLREISGDDFTAKDFRTWAGTVLTAVALRAFPAVAHAGQAKKNVVRAIAAVAKMLGNTPAVCRRCYIHPEIVLSYLAEGTVAAGVRRGARSPLKREEAAVLTLLRRRRVNNGNRSAKRGTIR
jgi:DNA topoisomerase-1